MIRILTLSLVFLSSSSFAQGPSPKDRYDSRIEAAQREYRKEVAQQIRSAMSVDLLLLRFDDVKEPDPFNDDESRFRIAPYGATCGIISKTKLNAAECKALLDALAIQIEKQEHSGGAMCHYPVHGIRVYSAVTDDTENNNEIYSGSFCWVCKNFGFEYPDSAEWLDTSSNLHEVVNKLLPVPEEELRRFKNKYESK